MKRSIESNFMMGTDQFDIEFDDNDEALWCKYKHRERACFTSKVLQDIITIQNQLSFCFKNADDVIKPRYVIWGSTLPGAFSLGGDLQRFADLVRSGEKDELRAYAYQCVKTVYNNFTNLDLPLLSITLVQGNALGGGFEAALTSDIIIAERHCKLGLPEIKFNLFPGMGAYSLLSRRLGSIQAKRMILSGRLYSAEEMYQLGIVDMLVEPSEGKAAVSSFIQQNRDRYQTLLALSKISRICQPVSFEELIDVTDLWVDAAMTLGEPDLVHMERLASVQRRQRKKATVDQ